jgi:hypothetical protein
MDVYSYEDRLRREAAAAEDVAIRGRAESASKINYENAFKQSLLRAQENSPLDSVMETARKYEVNGDQANADLWTSKGLAILKQYVDAEVETLTGNKATPEMFKNILLAGGTGGVERGVTEKGSNIRAAQQLPIQKLQADTSAGNLALARKKDVEESVAGDGFKTTDYYKAMHTKIFNVQKYLTSMKEYIESGQDVSTISTDWKSLLAGPATPKLLGQALTKLNQYDTEAMRKQLSPEKEAWIDRAMDIATLQQEKPMGVTPEAAGRLEEQTNQAIQAEAAPALVTPPVVPIRKYVLNTKTGEKYWVSYIGGQWVKE